MKPRCPGTKNGNLRNGERGQSIIEILPVVLLILTLTFAVIDFSRAIMQMEVLSGLTREGSNIASRGTGSTALTDAANTVIADGANIKLATQGEVIITAVQNLDGAITIKQQVTSGSMQVASRVGTGAGKPASLPVTSPTLPQPGGTIYVTEVFSSYSPITPVGAFAKVALPSTLYDIAYF